MHGGFYGGLKILLRAPHGYLFIIQLRPRSKRRDSCLFNILAYQILPPSNLSYLIQHDEVVHILLSTLKVMVYILYTIRRCLSWCLLAWDSLFEERS